MGTARHVADRICTAVTDADLDQPAIGLHVSISIGLTTQDFFNADTNLYRAERDGRDRAAS